jgi:hypothetical protein
VGAALSAREQGRRCASGAVLRLVSLAAVIPWPLVACAETAPREPIDISIADATIHVEFRGPEIARGRDELLIWVRRSASIVRGYYGFFPAQHANVRVTTVDGNSVRGGHAWGGNAMAIQVSVGRDIEPGTLLEDWVLVHEMIHLALPEVGDDQNWLAEGLATYVEGIARVQAGNMTDAELWKEYVDAMPKGLPAASDGGLDRTHTWASTYWGGALFCLLADVQIHEKSSGRAGLQTALIAVARASGGMRAEWPATRVFEVGDSATGTTVLTDLYRSMRDKPVTPDLAQLWQRMGIIAAGDSVRFEDGAPLAGVRRDITRARAVAADSSNEKPGARPAAGSRGR